MTERDALNRGDSLLRIAIKKELKAQGHTLTGALENSLSSHVVSDGKVTKLTGTMRYYGAILNMGVTAFRVPFQMGSGAGHSKYIDALTAYFKQRGLSDKEAKGAAFATAIKHKKEGMPTSASSRFSKTGKRKDFLADVEKSTMPKVNEAVTRGLDQMVQQEFNKTKSETI